jgi:hypothetical protein
MSLRESIQLFKENVAGATGRAPDNYPEWDPGGWPAHRAELLKYWSGAKSLIKRDLDKVAFIDAKLEQALASFDQGQREPGQSLMFEIYNVLNLNTLR